MRGIRQVLGHTIPDQRAMPEPANDREPPFRRLWAEARPVEGTLGERYLRDVRGIRSVPADVRFHARCPMGRGSAARFLPALLVGVFVRERLIAIQRLFLDSEIEDSQLRMIFACCHPHLARENQLALTLKTLCGFSHSEIAHALLVGEETIKKRLQRATRGLAEQGFALESPSTDELALRLDAVHQSLYLLFNEGYWSSSDEAAIRADLCEEAARLCHLLCSHPRLWEPATHALMALMLFHAARLDSRLDPAGSVLLMEDQDRSRWDQGLIRRAQDYLVQAARGMIVSRYHLEAGIASYHCLAPSYAKTNWAAILNLYDALLQIHPSPVCLLNRSIVVAQLSGPLVAIRELEAAIPTSARQHYHLFDAVLGEFYRRIGDLTKARQHLEAARRKTESPFDRQIIDRRLVLCTPEA